MKLTKNLINIFGPTASGKTNFSIELAKFLIERNISAQIVNFDSLLFYKELNIGTAKPTTEEMSGVTHHFVSGQSINNPINSSDFVNLAKPLIESLISKNVIPILVGGSGFYLRALLKGMYSSGPTKLASKEDKNRYENIIKKNDQTNNFELINFLKENDPGSLNNIHTNDFYRLSRAVEYFIINKSKLSDQKKVLDKRGPYDFENNLNINANPINIYLLPDKVAHLKIILNRTKKMIEDGLIKEVEELISQGVNKNLKPLGSIGYKETINFIEKKSTDQNELIEQINISTRQLAKAQKTFFKKIQPKVVLDPLNSTKKNIEKIFNLISDT